MYGTKTKVVGLLLQPRSETEANSIPVGAGLTVQAGNWNNPSAGTQTFLPMICDANSIKISDSFSFGVIPNATGDLSVFPSKDKTYVSNKSVAPKVSMDVFPTPIVMSSLFLLAAQFASQGASTNYNKTITLRNEEIDFYNTKGILATIQGVDSDGYGFLLENAVVDSISLDINNSLGNVIENLYKITVTFIGKKITRGTTTSKLFATLTGNQLIHYGSPAEAKTKIDTINFNSGDLVVTNPCWKSFNLTIANNFAPYCMGADSYLMGFYRSNPLVTTKITIPYTSETKSILNRVTNGESYAFTVSKYGLVSTNPLYFKITSSYNRATEDPEGNDNNHITINLNGQVEKGSGTWFEIINADGLDYLSKIFDTTITN